MTVRLVIMGVSGCGKSSVGAGVGAGLGLRSDFLAFHI